MPENTTLVEADTKLLELQGRVDEFQATASRQFEELVALTETNGVLKNRNQVMADCLKWIREDVVSGNPSHVERISRALSA